MGSESATGAGTSGEHLEPQRALQRARDEIASLRRELTTAQRELAQLRSESDPSRDDGAGPGLMGSQRVRDTLDHLLEGCQILGFDYRYLYINDAAERHNRRPKAELLGRIYTEMWPDIEQTPVYELIRDCVEMRRSHTVENPFTFPDGEMGHFELRIQPVPDGVFILSINISERRKAEQERELLRKQLVQAQTMEAVGKLSGGLAHDFNNMLAVVVSQCEVVLDELGPEHPLVEDIEQIQDAARHSADLVRQLLAFARRQPATPRVIDLNAAIYKLLDMLSRLIGEHIALRFAPGQDLWRIHIDPSQLDQLLLNLMLNARDAIRGSGRVTISTANVPSGTADDSMPPETEHVRLTVEDDGAGMSAETKERMFEPFFTTKPQGKGTGLGLASVYGIVKQNGAHIQVWSELGRGTRIMIDLPKYSGELATETDQTQLSETPIELTSGGHETILIVEDEPAILRVTERVVLALGYCVLTAGSAQAALELADAHPGTIDLLLSDVIMPDMNGRELADRLRAQRPDLAVLFMSGYTDDVIAEHGLLTPDIDLLQKPYSRSVLRARLRELLDRRAQQQ